MKTYFLGKMTIHRCVVATAIVWTFLLQIQTAWAQQIQTETQKSQTEIPFDPEVRHGKLSNGVTYYIKINPEPRHRIQLRLAVRAGSVLERESERGLAHFVEHMAFNGTASFAGNEIIKYLQSVGAEFGPDLNAYTSFDETVYFLEIPTAPDVMATGFQILSEWAYAVSFDPEEVERERGVVMEEWRVGLGADQRVLDKQLPILFTNSHYAERLPIGLPTVIQTATGDDMRAFYERWYQPDLMAVVVVGDFDDLDKMEAMVRKYFAAPPEGSADYPRAYPLASPTILPKYPLPPHKDLKFDVTTDPELSLTELSIYHKFLTPEQTGPDRAHDRAAYRRYLISSLFENMLDSRLYERTREADPPYLAAGAARYALIGDVYSLIIMAYLDQDGVSRGLDTLLEEMQRVVQHGFTATELEREKANLLRSIESAWHEKDQRPSEGLADEYVRHFVEGELVPGVATEYALQKEMLPQITLEDVNRVVDPWRTIYNTVALLSGPDSMPTGPEITEELIKKISQAHLLTVTPYLDEVSGAALLAEIPQPGTIVTEEPIAVIDAVKWVLSNGVTVIAKQTDFRSDEVLLIATSPGGTSLVEDADYIAALTADDLVEGSGVGEHDEVALEKLLAGNTAALSPYIDGLSEGFSGNSSPEHMETLFQLVTLYATEPRLDGDYYDSFVSSLKSQAENRLSQPDAVFADAYRMAISQDHFRKRPFTMTLVEELNMERSKAIYEDRFSNFGDFTFVIVGAFDWDELRILTKTYLATLPATGRVETWRDVGIDPPPGIVERIVYKGLDERSVSRITFAGDMTWSQPEALTLKIIGQILEIRLDERVREALGGTYSVGVGASASPLPDEEFDVTIVFSSKPSRADALFKEILSNIDWLHSFTEERYLKAAKEALRSNRQESLRQNGFWLSQIVGVVDMGQQNFGTIVKFDELLDNITIEKVQEAAHRYLNRNRYVRVVLLPENASETKHVNETENVSEKAQ